MSAKRTTHALQAAFLHTVSTLYALYDVFGASDVLREATAAALSEVFRTHLRRAEQSSGPDEQPLVDLLEQLERDVAVTGKSEEEEE